MTVVVAATGRLAKSAVASALLELLRNCPEMISLFCVGHPCALIRVLVSFAHRWTHTDKGTSPDSKPEIGK